ncbi:carboxypeptidase-like regulatory domain-containing protein [Lacinutrix sp. C3R15]|uniref:carboxypeptidase-like regulatory domain-containing protein n=1 Tax=Flavobacteriaceae TaxID=49546 RepID=UPI001C08EAB5|nr:MULTISPECIES: carboxypeptidase-like regulatory domain-containing protein [Flavobacteriaceae]MBU2939296.1 carboxypeptidase-like regulatory domain-containing protein [Lacinutrix sp. C3R15]MDO6622611.1 carboxypeptidase-like regulatory domain-containing protein [Oceanihabitans sp. 1_MG-2023]
MKTATKIKLLFLLFIGLQTTLAQTVEIHGKIVSDALDLENINVFNTTSKKGTITNVNGEFVIQAKLKDVIKISALFFKEVTVIINDEIIKSKALTILVKEEVNTLDEVVVLTHNLTGELVVDVENADYFKPIPIDFGTIDNLEFDDIRMNKPDNVFLKKGQLYNGFDPIEMLKLFGVNFKKKKKKNQIVLERDFTPIKDITEVYSRAFIHDNFKIPLASIESFYAFLQTTSYDYTLLQKENEVELLEFLLAQSKQFLKNN